jgi:pectin methylesterase-like acyl-CoA thioesterase
MSISAGRSNKTSLVLLVGLVASLNAISAQAKETVITVALDGSAQYKTVQEAIMAVPAGTADNPVIIRIKPGTYKELIYVQHEKRFFHLVGEDP